MKITSNNSLEEINRAISIPEKLKTSYGVECLILSWEPRVLHDEMVRIKISGSLKMGIEKHPMLPEFLASEDGRRYGICSWHSGTDGESVNFTCDVEVDME